MHWEIKKFMQFLFILKVMSLFINVYTVPFKVTQLLSNIPFEKYPWIQRTHDFPVLEIFMQCTFWYDLERIQRFLLYFFNSRKHFVLSRFFQSRNELKEEETQGAIVWWIRWLRYHNGLIFVTNSCTNNEVWVLSWNALTKENQVRRISTV